MYNANNDTITSERIRSALVLLRRVLGQDFWGAKASEPMTEGDVRRERNTLNAALRRAEKAEKKPGPEEESDQTALGKACAYNWLAGEKVKGYLD